MSEASAILVVDDDLAVGRVLVAMLKQQGFEAQHVSSAMAALSALDRFAADAVLSDVRMPGVDGMELLDRLQQEHPHLPVVMLTAHGSVALAVEAMKRGASDFLSKPFDRDEVKHTLETALAKTRGLSSVAPPPIDSELVGAAPAMDELRKSIARVGTAPTTVLVRGESGTGKELVARAVHDASDRRDAPYVVVHCAALPENLLESELFGYVKGAFTGAHTDKPGRAKLADGGTLFLDEIAEVPLNIQPKLLRLLQEREFTPLGSTDTERVDVRFIAATHRDLEAMVKAGEFREDLYYRLHVVPIDVPPLRVRRSDIPELAKSFARKVGERGGRRVRFEDEAMAALMSRTFRGNVRELRNAVERLAVLAERDVIQLTDVDSIVPAQSNEPTSLLLKDRVRVAERETLVEALARTGGNRTLAARALGVSRRTLYNKLEEHEIA